MSRIDSAFVGRKPFIGYLTAGDGGIDFTVEACLALVEGGVDLLEIGVPFSDPVADGPAIQRAVVRALERGTTPLDVLTVGERIRARSDVPLLLFSYYNPILSAGADYLKRATESGYDGILVVDLPPEEAGGHRRACASANLDPVFLVSPNTPTERVRKISECSSGFLYYVTRKGTTGVRKGLPEGYAEDVRRVKDNTPLPVASGFGIADRESAARALEPVDGFVVGSAFVKRVGEGARPEELTQLAREIDPRQSEEGNSRR